MSGYLLDPLYAEIENNIAELASAYNVTPARIAASLLLVAKRKESLNG